jgi:hypothetical protein
MLFFPDNLFTTIVSLCSAQRYFTALNDFLRTDPVALCFFHQSLTLYVMLYPIIIPPAHFHLQSIEGQLYILKWVSSVNIMTDYGRDRYFSLTHNVQNVSGVHPTSYPMGTGTFPPRVKLPERESSQSSLLPRLMSGVTPPRRHTAIWRDYTNTHTHTR